MKPVRASIFIAPGWHEVPTGGLRGIIHSLAIGNLKQLNFVL